MIYTILLIILLVLIIALIFATRLYRQEKKQRLQAENRITLLQKNIRILKNHSRAIKEIKKKKTDIDIKIKEAQTDEEVDNIIADILKSNNDRVSDPD